MQTDSNEHIAIWDKNARPRHEQILSGVDLSYDYILMPTLLKLIGDLNLQKDIFILDVGCGSGIFTCKLSQYANHIMGIDYSPISIGIAQEYKIKNFSNSHGNVEFICVSLENFDWKGKFDVVTANMVLHTVFDIENASKNILEKLRIGGRFILTLPHPLFYISREIKGFHSGIDYIYPSTHFIDFSISNDRNPMPESTPFIHRPISFYSTVLSDNGLLIEKILEPYPDNDLMLKYPVKWSDPRFIALQCLKYS